MNGILTRIEFDDQSIRSVLMAHRAFGQNPAAAMEDIATIGENTTRERFDTQIGPDGQRWKPSLRALINGGKTLTKDGHLGDSITHLSDSKMAEWGSNRIYARIHQMGGDILPKAGGSLRFRLASGAFVSTKKVTIPKREFLGVSDSDSQDMLDALQARIEGISRAH